MADVKKLQPFFLQWEGGYVNHPNDKGGETNMGITIATWRQAGHTSTETIPSVSMKTWSGKPVTYKNVNKSLYEMTIDQWTPIMENLYWNPWRASEIKNQSVADICVDWGWASGPITAIKRVQRILGVAPDGKVGSITLNAINSANQADLFAKIHADRILFVNQIVQRDATQRVNLEGWTKRINALKFS